MRAEYEFELYGEKFLAKTDSRGIVRTYERADDDSDWVGVDCGENPFAYAALQLARIIDAYDDLARKLAGDWPVSALARSSVRDALKRLLDREMPQ